MKSSAIIQRENRGVGNGASCLSQMVLFKSGKKAVMS